MHKDKEIKSLPLRMCLYAIQIFNAPCLSRICVPPWANPCASEGAEIGTWELLDFGNSDKFYVCFSHPFHVRNPCFEYAGCFILLGAGGQKPSGSWPAGRKQIRKRPTNEAAADWPPTLNLRGARSSSFFPPGSLSVHPPTTTSLARYETSRYRSVTTGNGII